MDTDGSFELAVLGLEEGVLVGVAEGLRLGLTEGIDVDGEPEGAVELRIVGDGEGLAVVGCFVGKTSRFAAEGAGVTFSFLQYHLGLRRHRSHRSAFFLSFPFFFRSSARFSLHFFRKWFLDFLLSFPFFFRSSMRLALHFFRILFRRPGG